MQSFSKENNSDDVFRRIAAGYFKFVTESLCWKHEYERHGHLPARERLLKDAIAIYTNKVIIIELYYGNCRNQCLWRLTKSRD